MFSAFEREKERDKLRQNFAKFHCRRGYRIILGVVVCLSKKMAKQNDQCIKWSTIHKVYINKVSRIKKFAFHLHTRGRSFLSASLILLGQGRFYCSMICSKRSILVLSPKRMVVADSTRTLSRVLVHRSSGYNGEVPLKTERYSSPVVHFARVLLAGGIPISGARKPPSFPAIYIRLATKFAFLETRGSASVELEQKSRGGESFSVLPWAAPSERDRSGISRGRRQISPDNNTSLLQQFQQLERG